MTGIPLLEVRGLTVSAPVPEGGGVPQCLLNAVSFSVSKGKVLGVIGESGAGKSTLGLAVLGYGRGDVKTVGGQVLFDGQDVPSLPEAARQALRGTRIAYVAQSAASAFNPSLPLGEQIIETPVDRGLLSRQQAWDRAISLLGLLGLPDPATVMTRYPHQVSGGQLQRAMTAMALCSGPDLVIFDEPTTALDVTTQIGVLQAIRTAIARSGTAALYISHDLALVAQIADDVLVLRHGQTVEYGPVRKIISDPDQDYTRQLVSAGKGTVVPALQDAGPLLDIKDIGMAYSGGEPVLSSVSASVRKGQTLALIGRSGSGKTSLGRVICGLNSPTAGHVSFAGDVLPPGRQQRSRDQLRRIQLIHQSPDLALNPAHTIEESIGRPLTLYWKQRGRVRRDAVRDLLQQVELPERLIDSYPAALSGGQKQRVCIARALAARPDLIVCDEPTSALDPLVAQGILTLLAQTQQKTGLSYLFITHDFHVVRQIAHHVAVLHQGRIIQYGPTDEVFSPPYEEEMHRLMLSVPELDVDWLNRVLADAPEEGLFT